MDIATLVGPPTPDDDRRIDQWVDHWAATAGEAPAVRADGRELTYRELVDAADRIAGGLRAQGVRPRDVVLVDVPRGAALIEVILGVLKCGAVYSIVDTDWPAARYAEVAERTQAWLCVGDPRGRPGAAPELPRVDPAVLRRDAAARPGAAAGGDHHAPCCVFFTSGSTGTPKGVLTTHRAIIRIARDPLLDVGPGHGMLQAAPSPWDAFAMEVWSPLVSGGTTVVHTGRYLGPDDLRAAVALGADTLFLTSTLFNTIVDTDVQAFAGVRTAIAGGERVSPAHLRRCRDEVAGVSVHNGYGPVEATVFATSFPMAGHDDDGDVPVGRPMLGTSIHVLDDEHRPVTRGQRGEIAVSGDGLAVEYLDDRDATAAAFPLVELSGPARTRVYLTGDVGWIGDDGQLRISGRRDRQFKIRGVRVEPAEVEAAIERLPGVSAVAVLPLPYGAATVTRTAACVVGTSDAAAVRDAVARTLPGGFVPDLVVPLSRLPMTANGKVDTAELARIATAAAEPVATRPAGATRPEPATDAGGDPAVLAAVRELLGADLGWDTDIFDAGASSITAIRIAHRLGGLAGTKINPAQIFHHPTPRALAALVEPAAGPAATQRSESRWQAGLPVPQWRFWYLEMKSPGNGDGLTPLQHRITGPLDRGLLAEALRVVIGRHPALRTRLVREGRRGVRPVSLDPAEVPDVLTVGAGCPAPDAYARGRRFLELPFQLDVVLPIRALLTRISPDDHLLTVSVHHTAFDGWSGGIFCRDLSDAYRALSQGREPDRRVVTDYREAWLAQDLRESPADRDELWEWTSDLLGVPDLPLGEGPRTPTGPVGEVWVDVPDAVRAAAERTAAAAGGTVQATLLAAWVRALREFTGADDFAVGIPVAGRTTAEVGDVIGCFTSGVAARFRSLPGGPGADLAQAVTQLNTALRFQYMPMERLLVTSPPRVRNRNPFCQAGFVVQNYDAPDLSIDGASCESSIVQHHRSNFELTLELWFDRGLGARLWFRTDVLTPELVAELGQLWLTELTAMSGHALPAAA